MFDFLEKKYEEIGRTKLSRILWRFPESNWDTAGAFDAQGRVNHFRLD